MDKQAELDMLHDEFNRCMDEIIKHREELERFLDGNPQHTFRPEVNGELESKIRATSREADGILALIDAIEPVKASVWKRFVNALIGGE